jgi:hypothetical protein
MSYKQVRVCDCYGTEIEESSNAYKISSIVLETDTFMDAAGSRDRNILHKEFCFYCANNIHKSLEKLAEQKAGK